jgi:zinc protease
MRFGRSAFVACVLLSLGSNDFRAIRTEQLRFKSLSNGVQIYVIPDHSVDTVTVHVTYMVGAFQDPRGACGTAHLLEHLMFRGSQNVDSGEFGLWIRRVGGEYQGSTGFDRTVFYETVPSSDLELTLYLEADRMHSLSLTSEGVEIEKRNIAAEAARKTNQQLERIRSIAWATLNESDVDLCPVVGVPSELSHVTVEDIRAFYEKFYAPRNAFVTVVGNCDPGRTLKLLERYFGGVAVSTSVGPKVSKQGGVDPNNSPKSVWITETSGSPAGIYLCFKIGEPNDRKWYSTFLLGRLLADGSDSILYRALVRDIEIARSVQFSSEARKGGTLGTIFIEAADPNKIDQLRDKSIGVLKGMARESIDREILSNKILLTQAEMENGNMSTMQKAENLSQSIALYDDIPNLTRAIQLLRSISVSDLQDAADALIHTSPIVLTATRKGTQAPIRGD